jgi:D-amino-acid dehydrogenase
VGQVDWYRGGGGRPDVVVIGGGIVGICAALYLQRTGRRVRVIERELPGGSASGHNGGILAVAECVPVGTPAVIRAVPGMLVDRDSPLAIRWSYLPRLAPWLARFLLASRPSRVEAIARTMYSLTSAALAAYQPLLADSEAAALIRTGGALEVYRTDRAFAAVQADLRLRSRVGTSFEVLDEQAIAAFDPLLKGRFRHGLHHPQWCYTTHPGELTRALARTFTERGGQVQQANVDGFRERDGRVQAVTTSDGDVPADHFVLAAGIWSRRLLRKLGSDVPLDTERGYGVDIENPGISVALPVICADSHYGVTPLGSGVRLVGSSELAGISAPPDHRRSDTIIRVARSDFPELNVDNSRRWMRFRPSMPDSLPVIGTAPGHANVYLAFGHGHKGLGQGAITGKLISELVTGSDPSVDLHPLRPTRFTSIYNAVPAKPRRALAARRAR